LVTAMAADGKTTFFRSPPALRMAKAGLAGRGRAGKWAFVTSPPLRMPETACFRQNIL